MSASSHIAVLCIGAWSLRNRDLPKALVGVGAIVAVAFGYVLYSSVIPVPACPYSLWVFAGLGVTAVSFVVAFVVKCGAPAAIARVGRSAIADTLALDSLEAVAKSSVPGMSHRRAGETSPAIGEIV